METKEVRQYVTFITKELYEKHDLHEWIVKQFSENHDITLTNWSAKMGNNQLTGQNIYSIVWYGYENN